MLWIYLIVLQILFFGGLLFFLRFALTRNISKATGRLHELSKDYAAKEEEANQLLQNAQREAKGLLAKETQSAQEAKEKIIAEAQEQSERVLKEASQKGAEIAEKAQRNADFLKKEIEHRIDESAKEKVHSLIQKAVPQDFLKSIHQKWIEKSEKEEFNLKHLKLPEKIKEAKIVSAFPLTDQQQGDLSKKLNKKIGADVVLKASVDPALIAGFVISMGSVVVDGSLKYKVQKSMQDN